MSAVVGIDLSSHAIDLVKLSEESNAAEWVRCELTGANAWERTLTVFDAVRHGDATAYRFGRELWDDVYLVAIEAPYGRGQAGTTAILNRVVGAVTASLPAALRQPHTCWLVAPHEWKAGLGLKGKPTAEDLERIAPGFDVSFPREHMTLAAAEWQNARDAYCIALHARDENARAVTAALAAHETSNA